MEALLLEEVMVEKNESSVTVRHNLRTIGSLEGLSVRLHNGILIGSASWLTKENDQKESFDIVEEWVQKVSVLQSLMSFFVNKSFPVSIVELKGCKVINFENHYQDDSIVKFTFLTFTIDSIYKTTEKHDK